MECHYAYDGTCCEFVSTGIKELSMFCTVLSELDISGCWQITDKSLYALQENLMHMRGENTSSFSLTVGGQLIEWSGKIGYSFGNSCSAA